MLILLYKVNYRHYELRADSLSTVPVRCHDGGLQYLKWCGFIGLDDAKRSGGKPIKLVVSAYRLQEDMVERWLWLQADESVQGCLLTEGVYAVTVEGLPRIIKNSRPEAAI